MRFGPERIEDAAGAILAHSLRVGGATYKKGLRLEARHVEDIAASGVPSVIVARLDADDVGEDAAAARIASALAPDPAAARVALSAPFTGRANLYAAANGLFCIDPDLVDALNALDESVTIATLPPNSRVAERRMLATVKIIPYAAPERAVAGAEELARAASSRARPRVAAPALARATVILTRTPGFSERALEKGGRVVVDRLDALGVTQVETIVAPHETEALARAYAAAKGDLILALAASATTDRRDVLPAAIEAAGGAVERVGMPVDPGNLLVLGALAGRPVLGLPGCARSPKLNGADWVLERLVCGEPVDAQAITRMGVGGLLKEIASRPEPRLGARSAGAAATDADGPQRPRVCAVLLAAGGSSRMEGRHKLFETVDGAPLLRRSAEQLLGADAVDDLVVVLGAEAERGRAALRDAPCRIVENRAWAQGMAGSLRVGLAAAQEADAALVALADMPDVDAPLVDRLVAAFDPSEGREIVRPVAASGRPGHPVLFGRRFFEALSALDGDVGARSVIAEHGDFVVDVETGSTAPEVDLDTPEAWAAWRSARNGDEAL